MDSDHWQLKAIVLRHHIGGAKRGMLVSLETCHLIYGLVSAVHCFGLSYIYMGKIWFPLSFPIFPFYFLGLRYNIHAWRFKAEKEMCLLHEVQNCQNSPLATQVRRVFILEQASLMSDHKESLRSLIPYDICRVWSNSVILSVDVCKDSSSCLLHIYTLLCGDDAKYSNTKW